MMTSASHWSQTDHISIFLHFSKQILLLCSLHPSFPRPVWLTTDSLRLTKPVLLIGLVMWQAQLSKERSKRKTVFTNTNLKSLIGQKTARNTFYTHTYMHPRNCAHSVETVPGTTINISSPINTWMNKLGDTSLIPPHHFWTLCFQHNASGGKMDFTV